MAYPLTDARRQIALDLLAEATGRRVNIEDESAVGHQWAPVTRLRLDRDLVGIGETVVVKTRRVEGEGYGGPVHLKREQAGLATAAPSGVTPRLIAADDYSGVLVMTDIGPGQQLEDVLLATDREAAEVAMVALGVAVGRLHAATLGSQEVHRGALTRLGRDPDQDRLGQWPGVDRWDVVERAADALGFPDARVARDDVADVLAALTEPGSFGALAHTDLNPTNVVVTAEGIRLVDFEGSVFGHVGVDLSFMHYPFPNYSANWSVLPADVVAAADGAYWTELLPSLPPQARSRRTEALVVGAAAALAVRLQRLEKVASDDTDARNRWRRRAQLVQQCRVFERMAAEAGMLSDLASWCHDLAGEMRGRWDDATDPPPPLFPAFGDTSTGLLSP